MTMNYPRWPNWAPLARLFKRCGIEPHYLDHFMYMGQVGQIQLYKHYNTRRYINLDCRLAYEYTGNGYRRISKRDAIRHAFGDLEVIRNQALEG